MDVPIQQLEREDHDAEQKWKGRAAKSAGTINAIPCWAHCVYDIPKIELELVEI